VRFLILFMAKYRYIEFRYIFRKLDLKLLVVRQCRALTQELLGVTGKVESCNDESDQGRINSFNLE
jgi:hypothetical protein